MDQLPARFVLASTSEVYGDPQERLQRETYWRHVNPIGPRSVYDEAKRYAEALTTAYRGTGRVDTAIARIFNTYGGPRMRAGDGRAIPAFGDQALTGEPLTVTGDGKQTRSLCYVDDRVRRLLALAEAAGSGTVNLGNPAELTILDLAQEIIELTGASSKIEYLPAMDDDRNDDARISRRHSPAGNRESRCAKALGTRSTGSRTRFAMYRTKLGGDRGCPTGC
jgi:dTDP-glucose 4,6-dehydratase